MEPFALGVASLVSRRIGEDSETLSDLKVFVAEDIPANTECVLAMNDRLVV